MLSAGLGLAIALGVAQLVLRLMGTRMEKHPK